MNCAAVVTSLLVATAHAENALTPLGVPDPPAAVLTAPVPLPAAKTEPATPSSGYEESTELPPLVVHATQNQTTIRRLKAAKKGGEATAVAGTGLASYLVIAQAGGPVVWALTAVYLGGMTAYLASRRLHGHDDFASAEIHTRGSE